MMALILSSLSAESNASINSFCMAPLKALSLSGRFRVMVRICSATSYLMVSYAMGGFLCVWFSLLYSSFRDAPLGAGLRCAIAHRGIHTHDRGYGFRARDFVAPRNDGKLSLRRGRP